MSLRIAEEAQLLAEEKWIIEALHKIKNQRNCLQIERLHLESLRSKNRLGKALDRNTNPAIKPNPELESHSSNSLMSNLTNPGPSGSMGMGVMSNFSNFHHEFAGLEPSYTEQLDLSVTKSVFTQEDRGETMEEYDEEDVDDTDNVVIDINMLMNGKCSDMN